MRLYLSEISAYVRVSNRLATRTKRGTIAAIVSKKSIQMSSELKEVVVYTDGACEGNPGPGGYGVVLMRGENS